MSETTKRKRRRVRISVPGRTNEFRPNDNIDALSGGFFVIKKAKDFKAGDLILCGDGAKTFQQCSKAGIDVTIKPVIRVAMQGRRSRE